MWRSLIIGSGNRLIKPRSVRRRVRRLACAASQCLANLGRELFQGVRLLPEICFESEHFVVEHGLSRIAGDEEFGTAGGLYSGTWAKVRLAIQKTNAAGSPIQ